MKADRTENVPQLSQFLLITASSNSCSATNISRNMHLSLSHCRSVSLHQDAIVIHEVYEEGAAARDGRLWAGDQILEVRSAHSHVSQKCSEIKSNHETDSGSESPADSARGSRTPQNQSNHLRLNRSQ